MCGASADSTLWSAGLLVVSSAESIAAKVDMRMMSGGATPLMSRSIPACWSRYSEDPALTKVTVVLNVSEMQSSDCYSLHNSMSR
ncbi:uncharacterized protein M421DRAFT_296384 [Didymella exigua CBS 183.55]|uniref:Secreted protein n=1 Tax=Didymella exigua CBS 183.55 TaxID=1150837 RepID=A0A6A5R7M4_9PLEO|nr:uncharacterized protein M421DRAFT_296384 [Didymella exigua CBS 183.55]KAF1924181.1 hypothetical protein M421DRAFT_296384 [Didymella exigua CBS 183.55]